MKHSEILQLAKYFIESEAEDFICHAVARVGMEAYCEEQARQITSEIQRIMWPHCTLEIWLNSQGVPKDDAYDFELIREYRLRWMDELIRIYEEAGK